MAWMQDRSQKMFKSMCLSEEVHVITRQIAAIHKAKLYEVMDEIALPVLRKYLAKIQKGANARREPRN